MIRSRGWSAGVVSRLWWSLPVFACLTAACPPSRFPEPFYLVTRPAVATVEAPGRIVLEAKCNTGEQMLGGGYQLPGGNTVSDLGVLESYPSAPDTWTVTVDNPTSPLSPRVQGEIVIAVAYCLTTPNYPAGMVIATAANTPGPGTPRPIVASCPAGATLTGGGYRTTPAVPAPLFNEHVIMSAPVVDGSGNATGWQVGLDYGANQSTAATTVYALCSTENLQPGGTATEVLDITTQSAAFDTWNIEAHCPENTFTAGGGYWILGDRLVPHPVSHTLSGYEYSRWRLELMFGYQTPNYDFRPCDPAVNPDCAKTAVVAACVKVPDIPFTKVTITAPADGSSFAAVGPVSPGLWNTVPITFTAVATDEDGAPLTGASLQWSYNGSLMGTGESLTLPLPVAGDAFPIYTEFTIRVVATGKTTSAADQIKITSGQIP